MGWEMCIRAGSGGCFLPPDAASLADLIDWDKLAALAARRTVVTE